MGSFIGNKLQQLPAYIAKIHSLSRSLFLQAALILFRVVLPECWKSFREDLLIARVILRKGKLGTNVQDNRTVRATYDDGHEVFLVNELCTFCSACDDILQMNILCDITIKDVLFTMIVYCKYSLLYYMTINKYMQNFCCGGYYLYLTSIGYLSYILRKVVYPKRDP